MPENIPHQSDEDYIRHTFVLAQQSLSGGDLPFGAIVVFGSTVVAESVNTATHKVAGHAEVNAIEAAAQKLGRDLTGCSLYTNFEPCAMCSFLIRDHNITRVVFSVRSPHWGGHSRWSILQSPISNPFFTAAGQTQLPEVVPDVLKAEGRKIFDDLGWKVHNVIN